MVSLPDGYYLGDAVTRRDDIYFLAGLTEIAQVSFFHKFSPELNQWTQLADIPEPAFNLAPAEVNGKVYAIGCDLFKDTTREYTPDTNSWEILEPMPTGRQHIHCGVYGSNIFVMGGLTSWSELTPNPSPKRRLSQKTIALSFILPKQERGVGKFHRRNLSPKYELCLS